MSGIKIGYARVSSTGQSLDVQLTQLTEYGCEEIFSEKVSGRSRDKREEFKNAMRFIRKGDTLVICKLDGLARSLIDLLHIKNELKRKGAALEILDQPEMNSVSGELMFNILGALAEWENAIRAERQRDGIQAAIKRGTRFGAKSKLTDEQVEELRVDRESGMLIREVMAKYKLSKATVYRLLADTPEAA